MVFITPKILNTKEDAQIATKTQVSRTSQKAKTMSLINLRRKVESPLSSNQEVILDRRSSGWEYAFNSPLIDDIVWQVPQNLDADKLELSHKGTAPFGFGSSRRLLPAPVKTYLKPSEGVIFKRYFYVEKPEDFKSFGIKVASDNAAAIYINGKLIDEDPMMKMKDGHGFEYWNREKDDIPTRMVRKGRNTLVVLLGSEKDSTGAYMDLMIIGNK